MGNHVVGYESASDALTLLLIHVPAGADFMLPGLNHTVLYD